MKKGAVAFLLAFSIQSQAQIFIFPFYAVIMADVVNDEELFNSYLASDTTVKSDNLNKTYRELNSQISKEANNPVLYLKRAVIKRKAGQRASALQDFEKAADLARKQKFSKGFLDSIDLDECIVRSGIGHVKSDCYNSYLLKYPSNEKAQFYKALSYYCFNDEKREERYFRAISAFEDVLTINPNNLDAKIFLGTSHYRLKHYDEAIEAYTSAINQSPSSGLAYYQRAKAYTENSQRDKACDDFKKAAELQIPKAESVWNKKCK